MNICDVRKEYRTIRAALPWLDAWHSVGTRPFAAAHGLTMPAVDLPAAGTCTLPDPDGNPVILKALEYPVDQVEEILKQYPGQNFIYATCDRKLIYDRLKLRRLAAEYDNFYICTANFTPCMLILEEFYGLGLTGKLVYGSALPLFSEEASLGPVVLSSLPWQVKCDIAGNTLRRLLKQPEIPVPEIPFEITGPILIDTHMHFSMNPASGRVRQPASYWRWPEWRGYMDSSLTRIAISTPSELLHNKYDRDPADILSKVRQICRDSGGRFRFYAAFNPNFAEIDRQIVEAALPMEECMGIKIHPASHKVGGDDGRYDIAFAAAENAGKVIMTHSWEDSSYNPVQKLTLPSLFEKHLKKHPKVKFTLGHAGGRPSTMDDVIRICRTYPNVRVDLSGDYFHDGMIETLTAGAGADRILFGTDAFWFNAFAVLGMLLGSKITDSELELITHVNAEKLYGIQAGGD